MKKIKVGDFIKLLSVSGSRSIGDERKVIAISPDGNPIVGSVIPGRERYLIEITNPYEIVPPAPVSKGWMNVYWNKNLQKAELGAIFSSKDEAEKRVIVTYGLQLLSTIEVIERS